MNKLVEKLEKFSLKLSSEVHIVALKNAFMSIIPYLVVAGFGTFLGAILLPSSFVQNTLGEGFVTQLSDIIGRLNHGGFTIMSLMVLLLTSYNIATIRKYPKPHLVVIATLSALFITVPLDNVTSYFATGGIFTCMVVSLTCSDLYLKLASIDKLKIKVKEDVGIPPAVIDSLNSLLSVAIVMCTYAIGSWLIKAVTGYEFKDLVTAILQRPMVNFQASLGGFLLLKLFSTFLWFVGIHPAILSGITSPAMYAALEEGRVINSAFNDVWGCLGGMCCTMGLVIAMAFSKREDFRTLGRLSLPLAIFNINEPVTFGLPLVFNPQMAIPFFFVQIIGFIIAYFAQSAGLVAKCTIPTTWSTPAFINGYIATGGDWRSLVLTAILIAMGVVIWGFFLNRYGKYLDKQQNEENK